MYVCEGTSATAVKPKQRQATIIAEEPEDDDENPPGITVNQTPVTALLKPRMLETRAGYSRLTTRRDRLAFLRRRIAVPGTEGQIQGERLYVERQPELRRMRLRPEPRPPAVMEIRPIDRREDDVIRLADVVPPHTVLLRPPPDDDEDAESLSNVDDDDYLHRQTSRTLENWRGLTYTPTTETTSSNRSSPQSRLQTK